MSTKYERFLNKNKRLKKKDDLSESDDDFSQFTLILSDSKRMNKILSSHNFIEYIVLLIQSYTNDGITRLRIARFAPSHNLKQYKHFKFSDDCSFHPIFYPKLKNENQNDNISPSRFIISSIPKFNSDKMNIFDLKLLSSDLQWISHNDIESYWNNIIAVFVLPNNTIQILRSDFRFIAKQKISISNHVSNYATKDTLYIDMTQTSKILTSKIYFFNTDDCNALKNKIETYEFFRRPDQNTKSKKGIYFWQQSVDGDVYMILKGKNFIKLCVLTYNNNSKCFECELKREIKTKRSYDYYKTFGAYYVKKWDTLFIATRREPVIIMINFNYMNNKSLLVEYELGSNIKLYAYDHMCLYYVKELNRLLIIYNENMLELDAKNLYQCIELRENIKLEEFNMSYKVKICDDDVTRDTVCNFNKNSIFQAIYKNIWNVRYDGIYKMIADYNQKCILCISESNEQYAPRFKYVITKYPINHESVRIWKDKSLNVDDKILLDIKIKGKIKYIGTIDDKDDAIYYGIRMYGNHPKGNNGKGFFRANKSGIFVLKSQIIQKVK